MWRAACSLAALLLSGAAPADHPAPGFQLIMRDGSVVTDRAVRGRLVILNFWATWCVPCKRELTLLDAFAARYGPDRVAVFAIDADRHPQARLIEQQASLMRIPIALRIAAGGDTYHPIGNAVPTTFVIDAAGDLVFARAGALSQRDLDDRFAARVPG